MTAVDSNILVYAYRPASPWYAKADAVVTELAEGRSAWAIPWPCISEFLAVITHPGIYQPPMPMDQALLQVAAWFESPDLVLLSEPSGFFPVLDEVVRTARITGPAVHDARIAALCHYYGVDKLFSADRGFTRFANYVRVENPLLS